MLDNQKSLPPVIRVFLSSTFADMDKERSYFNEVLVPKLSRMCSERGVSFFSVDLRWGITEEEQIDGKVLPICLSEIDKCRPYFIGILGNRYGSILETVPDKISDMIPWLKGKEGHSITELEMLYAVLEHNDEETVANSAFYFRSDDLTERLYGHIRQEDPQALENLQRLKKCIEEDNDTPCSRYNSIEEFGSYVMRDILNWLDEHFPESEDIDAIRSEWYNSEILRNHVANTEFNLFLDSYIYESKKPLMIYGDGARGKTSSLTAWQPESASKILINCGADDKFMYWPSIVEEIVKQLAAVARETDDALAMAEVNYLLDSIIKSKVSDSGSEKNDGKREAFFYTESSLEKLKKQFLQLIQKLHIKKTVVIVINDLNLLDGERNKLLCWLPSVNTSCIKLVCSTNDDEMVRNVEVIGWNIKDMPLLNSKRAERFVREFLGTYGKSFSSSQLDRVLSSKSSSFPGLLRFIIRFLINHGRFENLDSLIDSIASFDNIQDVYEFIYNFLMQDYSTNEQKIARTVLSLVRACSISLNEKECFELSQRLVDISPIEWANICRAFEQLEIIHGDYWNIRSEETEKFVDRLLGEDEMGRAYELLGDYTMELISNDLYGEYGASARLGSVYSKAAIIYYEKARAWEKLISVLGHPFVLSNLYLIDWEYVRSAWLKVFLYTEIDISESISEIVRDYFTTKRYANKKIFDMLLGLLVDFEYETELEILCDELKIDAPQGTIDSNSEGVSVKFIEVYKQIRELQNKDQYRMAYEAINDALSSSKRFDEMERCQLLFAKGNAEIRLEYYTEAVETANEYYKLALRMGYFFEMRRALSMRSNALFRLGRYDEAKQIIDRTIAFALSEGEMRTYLGAINLIAMMSYHQGKYQEAILLFDELYGYWCKIGNVREVCAVVLNKCNALSYNDEYEAALKLAETWYNLSKNDKELMFVSTTILGNMGFYAYECCEYEKSEKYLLMALDINKKSGFESSRLRAYSALISLYDKTDSFGKKLEIYKEKLEFLWERGEYEDIISDLKKIVEQLLMYKHSRQANELENYWRAKFSMIKGGSEYFEEQINSDSLDSVSLDALEEQLVIAKSESDMEKIAGCHVSLAEALKPKDLDAAIEHYLSAIDAFFAIKNKAEAINCAGTAISLLFDKGTLKCRATSERIIAKLSDDSFRIIVGLWESVATGKDIDVPEALSEIVSYGDDYALVISLALCDLGYIAIEECRADQLIELINKLPTRACAKAVAEKWDEIMLEDIHRDEAKLIREYMSSEAEKLIERFEKSIAFLNVFDRANAATLAGNIAVIFRRRGDKEKTLYYHSLSMEIFKEKEKHRDSLIEMTNLATAYHAFGDTDKSIEILREALILAEKVSDEQQRALIADNLADFLRMKGREEDKEEILRCFEIGEAFFRSAGFVRDLIISLRNQVLYLCNKEPKEVWEPKLKEAGRLVRENGFREFDQDIVKLEWFAYNQSGDHKSLTIDEVREQLEGVLNKNCNGYGICKSEELDGLFKFFVLPAEQVRGREEFYYFYEVGGSNTIHLITAYAPDIPEKNSEVLQEYISWWNKLGEYTLEWNNENKYLSAHAIFRASDWDGISEQLKAFISLWTIDKSGVLAIFSDSCSISDIQGLKLTVLNK